MTHQEFLRLSFPRRWRQEQCGPAADQDEGRPGDQVWSVCQDGLPPCSEHKAHYVILWILFSCTVTFRIWYPSNNNNTCGLSLLPAIWESSSSPANFCQMTWHIAIFRSSISFSYISTSQLPERPAVVAICLAYQEMCSQVFLISSILEFLVDIVMADHFVLNILKICFSPYSVTLIVLYLSNNSYSCCLSLLPAIRESILAAVARWPVTQHQFSPRLVFPTLARHSCQNDSCCCYMSGRLPRSLSAWQSGISLF